MVTGFGPFPGVPFNASTTLVQELAAKPIRCVPRAQISTAILPTDWRMAAAEARRLIAALRPDAVLHFGVSRRCTGFEIEMQARNLALPYLDVSGRPPLGRTVRRGAPPVLGATLPAPMLVHRLRLAGLPALMSRDAGRYLCNALLYETLLVRQELKTAPLAGFVHIPSLPEESSLNGSAHSHRAWRELRLGADIIIRSVIPEAAAAKRNAQALKGRPAPGSYTAMRRPAARALGTGRQIG